ncbi:hypothetical protein MHYP_G00258150 [Metynnis hypsauchen]
MQKPRQEHMNRQQRWKKERLRKTSTPGQSGFNSEDEPRRRDFGADCNTDHTMEDSVGEQEITAEEPGPQPQAFSEP